MQRADHLPRVVRLRIRSVSVTIHTPLIMVLLSTDRTAALTYKMALADKDKVTDGLLKELSNSLFPTQQI